MKTYIICWRVMGWSTRRHLVVHAINEEIAIAHFYATVQYDFTGLDINDIIVESISERL